MVRAWQPAGRRRGLAAQPPEPAHLSPCGSTTARPVLTDRGTLDCITGCGGCGGALFCATATLLPKLRTKNWRRLTARTCSGGCKSYGGSILLCMSQSSKSERCSHKPTAACWLSLRACLPQVHVRLHAAAVECFVQSIQRILQSQVLRLCLQRLLRQRVSGCAGANRGQQGKVMEAVQ